MAKAVSRVYPLPKVGDVVYMKCSAVYKNVAHFMICLGIDAKDCILWAVVVTSSRDDQEKFNKANGECGDVLVDIPQTAIKGLKYDSVVNAASLVRVRVDEYQEERARSARCCRGSISAPLLRKIRIGAGNSTKLLSSKLKKSVNAIDANQSVKSFSPVILKPSALCAIKISVK